MLYSYKYWEIPEAEKRSLHYMIQRQTKLFQVSINHHWAPYWLWCGICQVNCTKLTVVYFGLLWYTVVHCGTLCYTVVHCGTLWYTVVHCGSLWFTVVHCGSLWFPVVH